MTIEQAEKVDGLGIDAENGEVVLMISDHLGWHDQPDHFSKLEQKLGSYLNFAQSGQLLEVMPQAKGLAIRIKLIHEHTPTIEAKTLLDSITKQLLEMHFAFSCEVLPSDY